MNAKEWQTIYDALQSLYILALATADAETCALAERAIEIHEAYRSEAK